MHYYDVATLAEKRYHPNIFGGIFDVYFTYYHYLIYERTVENADREYSCCRM